MDNRIKRSLVFSTLKLLDVQVINSTQCCCRSTDASTRSGGERDKNTIYLTVRAHLATVNTSQP